MPNCSVACGPDSKGRRDQVYEISAYPSRRSIKGESINGVTYEGVSEFIFLGTLISNDNSKEKRNTKRHLGRQQNLFCCYKSLQDSTSFQSF